MARSMGLPATLDTLVKCIQMCLKQPVDGKDMEGRQIMLKFCKPGRNGNWYWDDAQYQRLGEYCAKDVELTRKIFNVLRPLDERERRHMQLTETINARGIKIDVELAKIMISMADAELKDINKQCSELTDGAVPTINKIAALKTWLTEKTGKHFVTANAFVLRELLDMESIDPKVRKVIELRLRGAKTSVSKIAKMLEAMDPKDHTVRGMLLFNGAGKTGRWSSRIVQLHNMPRAGYGTATEGVIGAIKSGGAEAMELLFPNVMDELPKLIRSLIIARPDKKFICGDFAGIEARILAWLAGAQDKLQMYRDGEDIYQATAERIGYPGERQLGKTTELALGYMGGLGALADMASKFGIQLGSEEGLKIIEAWRRANVEVVTFWRNVWETACDAMRNPGTTCHVVEHLGLSYMYDRVHLWCRLPSGRLLCNPFAEAEYVSGPKGTELQIKAVSASKMPAATDTEWPKLILWPGILVENICQAIGADLLRWSIETLEDNHLDVALHVHDEFLIEVPHHVEISTVAGKLTTLPAWAEGLPFDISWWEGRRYKK
jgi:DNA polymerase